jgi:hypothetical protein
MHIEPIAFSLFLLSISVFQDLIGKRKVDNLVDFSEHVVDRDDPVVEIASIELLLRRFRLEHEHLPRLVARIISRELSLAREGIERYFSGSLEIDDCVP